MLRFLGKYDVNYLVLAMDPISSVGGVQVGLQVIKQAANQENNVANLIEQARDSVSGTTTTNETSQTSPSSERGQVVDIEV